jgi:hypothetical protein
MVKSPIAILYDASGNPLAVQDGTAIPVDTSSLLLAGSDGSNARHLKTDFEGHLITIPATVSGSAANMINLSHAESLGAYVSGQWRRVLTYTIPVDYSAYLIRFTTWQNESAFSRIAIEKGMGALDFPTNGFTPGDSYTAPQWSDTHVVEAVVTTQLGAANNVVVTVNYTNEEGVAGRTGTFSIPKSSIVGTRAVLDPQVGDLGVRSIQGMSVAPSGGAGVIDVQAAIQLALHFDLSSTSGEQTLFAPSAVSFPEETVIGIEFAGGTVSKDRKFDALIQLVL